MTPMSKPEMSWSHTIGIPSSSQQRRSRLGMRFMSFSLAMRSNFYASPSGTP